MEWINKIKSFAKKEKQTKSKTNSINKWYFDSVESCICRIKHFWFCFEIENLPMYHRQLQQNQVIKEISLIFKVNWLFFANETRKYCFILWLFPFFSLSRYYEITHILIISIAKNKILYLLSFCYTNSFLFCFDKLGW